MNRLLSKYLFYYPATLIKGERVNKYLSTYREQQYYSYEKIKEYQMFYLKKIINHAYSRSTYYKVAFDKEGVLPSDLKTLSDLKNYPIITKNDLAASIDTITTTAESLFVNKKTTGGSTGQVVTLLKNADALARERAATWRAYEWASVSVGDAQARFWGSQLYQSQRLKYKVIDLIANRMRLSAFEINDARLEKYYHRLHKFKPAYLYGYVSIIEAIAKFIQTKRYKLPASVKSIITTSEVLTDKTREYIEKKLAVRVYNEYGCGEVGSIAHECEYGNMHIMEDNLIIEIENDHSGLGKGEIIVTDLHNYATPLIRYRLGDFATFTDEQCACGRRLKILSGIHGRAYDCILTEEGNSFHPEMIMYIFEDIKEKKDGILQFQVIQKSLNHMHVKIVKADSFNSGTEDYISNEFNNRLSSTINTTFEYVDSIVREKSGKLRLIKSEIIRQ